jgi:hypothetical protein
MYINSRAFTQDSQGGQDLKDLISPGGYLQDLQDTQFRSNHYRILQGPLRKNAFFFLPFRRTEQADGKHWPAGLERSGGPRARLRWRKGRGGRENPVEGLTHGRGWPEDGRRRRAAVAGGPQGGG